MPRTYAFQVDDETEQLIEHDRMAISQSMGLPEVLTASQYFRLVVRDRLGKRMTTSDPNDVYKFDGYRDGLKQGFNQAIKRFGEVITELSHEDIDG